MMLKEHKKMYKKGRQWLVATIATVGVATGLGFATTTMVHADVTAPTTEVNQQPSPNQDQVLTGDPITAAPVTAQSDQAVATVPIYGNPTNAKTPQVANGLTYGSQLVMTDSHGVAQTTDEGSGTTILNVDNAKNLSQLVSAKNTSNIDQKINLVVMVPKGNQAIQFYGINVKEKPAFDLSALQGGTFTYSAGSGEYLAEDQFLAKYAWADVVAMQIKGTLAAGAGISGRVELTDPIITDDVLYSPKWASIGLWSYPATGGGSVQQNMKFRIARQVKAVHTGYFAVKNLGNGKYMVWPQEVQDLIAGIPTDKITSDNFGGDFNNTALFTGGREQVPLAEIEAALDKSGYSVASTKEDKLRQVYTYTITQKGAEFVDPSGDPVTGTPGNGTRLYIEVHQVIKAADSSMVASPSGTFDPLKDVVGSVPYDDHTVTTGPGAEHWVVTSNDVDPKTPGTYHVTYTYTGADYTVTKTVTVTVLPANNGGGTETPGQPGNPENPVQPEPPIIGDPGHPGPDPVPPIDRPKLPVANPGGGVTHFKQQGLMAVNHVARQQALPQTDDQTNAIVTLAGVALMSLLGLVGLRKKN